MTQATTYVWPVGIVATLTEIGIVTVDGDRMTAMSGNTYRVLQQDDQQIVLEEDEIVYRAHWEGGDEQNADSPDR